jgi:acetolactate synthase-1/2/3 large subunit
VIEGSPPELSPEQQTAPLSEVHQAQIDQAKEMLEKASHPVIWLGSGSIESGEAIARIAESLAAPVFMTYGARGVLSADHPCAVGLPPHVPPAGALWDEADVVLAIGSDFDGMNTQNWRMPQPRKLIAINVDAVDAGKNYRVDLAIESDAGPATELLARSLLREPDLHEITHKLHHVRAVACADLDETALRFLEALTYALPEDEAVFCDMCIPGYWVGGFHSFRLPRRLAYPVGWGTLGFGFPAAIGAALSDQGKVVAITGDGGFLYACGELATIKQNNLPLTTVIVDDGGYGMLRFDQDRAGKPQFGVDLETPDFVALAGSFGITAEAVEGLDEEFGEALARHVATSEPTVLVSHGPALQPPPTTSPLWYRALLNSNS